MKVYIDDSPLKNENSTRGVGYYTRHLIEAVEKYYPEIVITSIAKEADIIHYTYFDLFFLTLPLIKTKPTIVTIHDVIPLLYPKYFPVGVRGTIRFWLQQLSLKNTTAIVTVSEHSKKDISKYLHIHPEKIHVAYQSISNDFKPVGEAAKRSVIKKYGLDAPFFMYIGDVNYNKNIPRLIEAFATIHKHDAMLVLVGKTFLHDKLLEVIAIDEIIRKYDVHQRVRQLGFVPDEDLPVLYSLATAYVQPSLYEGFGIPVLQAFACGTPVVSSNRSALPELIDDAALEINPTDVHDISKKLEEILHNEQLRTTLVKKGFARAKLFTQKQFADAIVALYKEVLA